MITRSSPPGPDRPSTTLTEAEASAAPPYGDAVRPVTAPGAEPHVVNGAGPAPAPGVRAGTEAGLARAPEPEPGAPEDAGAPGAIGDPGDPGPLGEAGDPARAVGAGESLAPSRPAGADEFAGSLAAVEAVEARPGYADPVSGLLRVAAAERPLEDVARLITLLEQSEDGAGTAAEMLRAVGTERPVEDVSRLAALLSRPPHHADDADRMIRAAAEARPVEEVTRLMSLLHRPPLEQGRGDEAVRAAATGRPVEELAHLIELLAREREVTDVTPAGEASEEPREPQGPTGSVSGTQFRTRSGLMVRRKGRTQGRVPGSGTAARAAAKTAGPAPWVTWLATALLALCGAAYFPLHRHGAPANVYALALALSGVCLVLALLLAVRPSRVLLCAAVVVPAALAGAQVAAERFGSPGLARSLGLTLAPSWLAGPAAVVAAVAALAALLVRAPADRRVEVTPT
ncbi:hypothetical protein [Streptomyces griseosporeus]|uniref:hypothetical protein n=1 Tax=Streptomyces griseosporeus TaxID=1910 RepID=UPI00367B202D